MGVEVEYVGTAPTVLDPVYLVMTGTDAGKWAASSGGVSQVTQYTVTTSAADDIIFDIDGLPQISVAATNNAAADAASIIAVWLAEPQYFALIGNDASNIVDNADGTFVVTYVDEVAHVETDASTGANAFAGVNSVEAVAANAKLLSDYSWGMESILPAEDLPARAFLRLSKS